MFNQDNFITVEAHNQLYLDGSSSYFTRINSFSDLTFDEFAQVDTTNIIFSFIPTNFFALSEVQLT